MSSAQVAAASLRVAPSPKALRAIAQFVLSIGYTEAQTTDLGLTKIPWRESQSRLLLSGKVPEDSALGLLIRLFFFGEDEPSHSIRSSFPDRIVDSMLASGMLQEAESQFLPGCMLTHFGNLLLACDSVNRARAGSVSDLVLGVNLPTHILGTCMLPLENAEVLDLGTGCGSLGLKAASTARHVVATDINSRAMDFVLFNAALNGLSHVEALDGDRFEPVRDRRFDLIICNPPFFVSPNSKLLFTDNSFLLDSFVESLARQAPAFLNEGGYFQMLCEWVEVKNEAWPDRVRNWFQNSACDVLVLKAYEITPVKYVLKRAAESASLHGESTTQRLLEHTKYLEDHGVEKIYGGLVTIRRPTVWQDGQPRSRNWFVIDEMDEVPSARIGELLLERFSAEDLLNSGSDSRLLSARPQLAKDVILVQEAVHESRNWKPTMIYLERRAGLARRLGFNAEIAQLIAGWDGSEDLNSLISAFAREKKLPKNQVTSDCLRLARRLASLGLISFRHL